RWAPNIQRLRVLRDGSVQRIDVCTSCVKAGKIQRAPSRT
ncbi:MAG: 50S ribosomal protein L28, partial [Actinomycetota bacterium]|nr:50S ribosomal protein L28 [Actinomycetota bacterium]